MKLNSFIIKLFAPLYSRLIGSIAYGPWGPLHRVSILIFKRMFKIEWSGSEKFENLGAFFLRKVPLKVSESSLVSPAEARVVDGPTRLQVPLQIAIKGLRYNWKDFFEINLAQMPQAMFWNFYLAPHNYHWVHAPCQGINLEAFYHSGAFFPVNSWGRKLAPDLYSVNERITFKWKHPEFGEVIMICVGAMAVSRLRSAKGAVKEGCWVLLAEKVQKAEEILAFELGSTVILILEKPPTSLKLHSVVSVGDGL